MTTRVRVQPSDYDLRSHIPPKGLSNMTFGLERKLGILLHLDTRRELLTHLRRLAPDEESMVDVKRYQRILRQAIQKYREGYEASSSDSSEAMEVEWESHPREQRRFERRRIVNDTSSSDTDTAVGQNFPLTVLAVEDSERSTFSSIGVTTNDEGERIR